MKKIFLIIAATIVATTVWGQSGQLITVKGKTKDGKSINVQYYKGTAQDYIESVKYQLVDELKAENKTKQNSINDLQYQLNKANKTIDNLNEQLKNLGDSDPCAEIAEQLNQKQKELDQLNEQNNALNAQLREMQIENDRLRAQLDSIKEVNRLLSQNKNRRSKSPVIGVEANMGSVFLSKSSLSNPWEKVLSWNKQVAVYYGTSRLSENFPISIEAGVGFRSLPMKAKIDYLELSDDFQPDCDNDTHRPDYVFDNFFEKLTMNCLEVPVRLCIGQPSKDKVSVYAKLGVSPSFILSSKLANGVYTKKGYYLGPDSKWHVTFDEIKELGFFNNGGEESQKVTPTKKFSLWGNAAFGAYVPLSSSILFNVGAKLDYPIMKTSTFTFEEGSDTSGTDNKYLLLPTGLENYNGRMLIPSLQAGVVYTVK